MIKYSKILIGISLALTYTNSTIAAMSDHFVSTWKTDNPGISGPTSITIPAYGAGYQVDWNNDGDFLDTDEAIMHLTPATHDYGTEGTYTVRIKGGLNYLYLYSNFFIDNDRLKLINLNQWGTISWTNMANAFYRAENMIVSATDTPDLSGVSNMSQMFYSATKANPNTTNWVTTAVRYMNGVFWAASSATPDTTNWDTTNVISMKNMFSGAINSNPNTTNWITKNVVSMQQMFSGAINANPNTSNWVTKNVTNMQGLFSGAINANPNTTNWDTSKVIDMSFMFSRAVSANPITSMWDTSNVIDMRFMFANANIANPDISMWNTSKVTDMSYMFSSASSANPNTSMLDTSKVTNMRFMFANTSVANPDTSTWNTFKVTDMSYMFRQSTSANPNTTNWQLDNVTRMDGMFSLATNANPDTNLWNTNKVISMTNLFDGALKAQPITTNWNTSKVTNMYSMFKDAILANPDTSLWDTSKVTRMDYMFDGATNANPNTSNWITTSVTSFGQSFKNAINATPDVSNWDISSVSYMYNMFSGVSLPIAIYDDILKDFNTNNPQININFHGGSSIYCSSDAQLARSNLLADYNWTIIDEGLCAPTISVDLTTATDSGVSNIDDITNDNTPEFTVDCSFTGNIMKIYSNQPFANTYLGSHVCLGVGLENVQVTNAMTEGLNRVRYTQFDTQGQSDYSPQNKIFIDTNPPIINACSTIPEVVKDGTPVITTCTGVENNSFLTISNMSCTPIQTDLTGIVTCTGTVGTSAGEITVSNDNIILSDIAGNNNNSLTTGLTIDNLAPNIPIIDTIAVTHLVITGTAEIGTTIGIHGAVCTNAPVITDGNGIWSCTLASTLPDGNQIAVNATDIAGNTSSETSTFVIPVNIAPTFTIGCDLDLSYYLNNNNNSLALTPFINNINLGPASESSQQIVGFTVMAIDDPSNILNQINIDNSGALNAEFSLNYGVATVDIVLQDDGGTDYDGEDTSTTQSFNIIYTDISQNPNIIYINSFDLNCASLNYNTLYY